MEEAIFFYFNPQYLHEDPFTTSLNGARWFPPFAGTHSKTV